MKMTVFWDVAPCSLVDVYLGYCANIRRHIPEDASSSTILSPEKKKKNNGNRLLHLCYKNSKTANKKPQNLSQDAHPSRS
jgi:hypothetical protein